MSYAIMPYTVDLAELRSLLGSGDEALLARLTTDDRIGYDFDSTNELGGGEAVPARTALRQMIMGEEYDAKYGYVYGYCWKILCEAYGRWLTNEYWSAMRYSWFDMVEEALREAGVRFSPTDLIYSGPGVRLPSIDDFPAIGHVERAEMRAMRKTLEGATESSVGDPDVLNAVREIEGWLRTCVAHDRDLVCFYH